MQFSFIGAALTVSYPFMKRFFPLPQFYLGAAFGWAVPMAFVATVGTVPRIGWLLFIVTLLWAGVYDTLYAMVDRDDDLKLGVQSTRHRLRRHGPAAGGRHAGHGAGRTAAGRACQPCCTGRSIFRCWRRPGCSPGSSGSIRDRDRDACFKAFLNNHYFGLVVFAGVVFGLRPGSPEMAGGRGDCRARRPDPA